MQAIKDLQAENRRLAAQYTDLVTYTQDVGNNCKSILQDLKEEGNRIKFTNQVQETINDTLKNLIQSLTQLLGTTEEVQVFQTFNYPNTADRKRRTGL